MQCNPLSLTHVCSDKMAAMFADDFFPLNFLNENCCTLIQISLKFVPKDLMTMVRRQMFR